MTALMPARSSTSLSRRRTAAGPLPPGITTRLPAMPSFATAGARSQRMRGAWVLACALAAGCGGRAPRSLSSAPAEVPVAAPHALLVPDAGRLYHGVLPRGTTEPDSDVSPESLDGYERAVGRKVAWVYFSNDWFRS